MTEDLKEEQVEFTPAPGTLTACDVHSGPCYTEDPTSEFSLTTQEKRALLELATIAAQTDTAARRVQVEQAWEARWFLRGYQHLLPKRGGGWSLPGDSRWSVNAASDQNGLYSTNIYKKNHDIVIAALSSDTPRVQFFPRDPDQGPDVIAAENANKYKYCWAKSNDLNKKMSEIASYFWTDSLSVLYTRSVADGPHFGYIDTDELDPEVPEDENNELDSEFDNETTAPAPKQGAPRVREITSVYGALEAKLPISVQCQSDMGWLQIYTEVDIAIARARYPWIAKKIKPSGAGPGEVQLDRIARMNVKLALPGSYVTGDSMVRDATIQKTWVRPSMFMDDAAKNCRDSFLEKFPNGVLVECAGSEFACAYPESMDDCITILHSTPGDGQSRAAMGSSLISVQKRYNTAIDLQFDFLTKTVPHKYMDAYAFDVDAISAGRNTPGAYHPFQRVPGVPVSELIFTDPPITSQPQLGTVIEYFGGPLSEMLSGATPSLFGGATNTDTVGGIIIQRNQALQRYGPAWNAAKTGVAIACQQAVMAAAENGNGTITDTMPGGNRIKVEIEDLRGNTLCYPENDSDLPESHAQRESRFIELVQGAKDNPFYQKLLQSPKNAKIAKDAIRMSDLEVPGAASVEKQQAEFEILLKSGPAPNPQLTQVQEEIQKGTAEAAVNSDPQVTALLQQLQQMASTLPPQVSTVEVATDASEDHVTEAAVCFDWMNSADGRAFKNGDDAQRDAFANVKLHWTQHTAMVKQLAPPAPPPPMKINGNVAIDKLTPAVQAAVFSDIGLNINPDAFQSETPHEITQEASQPTVGGGTIKQKVSVARKPLQ